LRQIWLGLSCLALTGTCARPGPLPLAHAEPPKKVAASPVSEQPHAGVVQPKMRIDTAPSYTAGSLTTFFDALNELRRGTRKEHVRVLWLGDSHTNADFLSGRVRSELTAAFGDGGPGFVRIGARPYRHDGLKVAREGSWNVDPDPPARRVLQDDGVFGLAGTRAGPEAGASFAVQVSSRDAAANAPAGFELSYTLPRGASFLVELSGRRVHVNATTPAEVGASGIAHLTLTAPLASQLVLAPERGAPRFFGVVIERRDHPGVVLDTAGIDGARLETPLAWNEAAFVDEVARRAPALLVIAFGTNEAFDRVNVEKYGRQLAGLVGRVRRGAPQVSCLVLGPTDAPLGDASVPRVAEVARALQKASATLGCSFASLQQLMGGEGSFAKGMKAKERLAQPDKLHLTPKGYQELGRALAKLLLDAYSEGRADLP
jgi:lysophospholipase L1-like esterase